MTAANSTVKTFYTYAHYRADQPDLGPFYIGKGKGPRAWKTKGTGRSKHWQRIATKHGVRIEIIAHWPTEQDALDHERLLIDCFRYLGTGLINLTDGGDGLSNPTPEVRAKIALRAIQQWADPKQREALIQARGAHEAQAKKSASLKRAFAAPGSRERRSKAVRAAQSRPEVRAKITANAADPAYRAKLSAGVKKALATPESKQKKSAASKAMWADAEHRARFAELMRQKAEERWATIPPEKAAKLRRAAELDAARKAKRQKTSDDSSSNRPGAASTRADRATPASGNASPVIA